MTDGYDPTELEQVVRALREAQDPMTYSEVRFGIVKAWESVSEADRPDFWQFTIKVLPATVALTRTRGNEKNFYDGLCAGIAELERVQDRPVRASWIPRTSRRLSIDDSKKGVARHKHRLFEAPDSVPFLELAFCKWIQARRLDVLLSILDVLGCKHNAEGILIGDPPEIDRTASAIALNALRGKHSSYDLELVCVGLMVSHEAWASLADAVSMLQSESPAPAPAPAPAPVKEPTQASTVPAETTQLANRQPFDTSRSPGIQHDSLVTQIAQLETAMQALAKALIAEAAEMGSGRLNAGGAIRATWNSLETEFHSISAVVGQSASSIEELRSQLRSNEQRSLDLESIRVLLSIGRQDGSTTDLLKPVRQIAESILSPNAHLDTEGAMRETLEGALALIQLVKHGSALDDDVGLQYFNAVQSTFGPAVALAASRGRLVFWTGEVAQTPALSPSPDSAADNSDKAAEVLPRSAPPSASAEPMEMEPEELAPRSSPLNATTATASPPLTSVDVGSSEHAIDRSPHVQAAVEREPVSPAIDAQEQSYPVPPSESAPELAEPCSFQEFQRTHWINEFGRSAPAPWTEPSHIEGLMAKAEAAWSTADVATAYLYAKALAAHNISSPFDPLELAIASRLLDFPSELGANRSATRLPRMKALAQRHARNSSAISLTIEALAPSLPCTLAAADVENLLQTAGVRTPALAEVLSFALNGWAAATDPIEILRAELDRANASDPKTLNAALKSAQQRLQEIVTNLYSAAGGRIQRTHCRKAWSDFVTNHVTPIRVHLAPLDSERKKSPLTLNESRQRIADLVKSFSRIMETASVKHQDLSAALAGAQQIVAAMETVLSARFKVDQLQRKQPATNVPYAAAQLLLNELPSDSAERISTLLIRAVLKQSPQVNELKLSAQVLLSHPDLLRMITPEAIGDQELIDGIDVSQVIDTMGATAILIQPGKATASVDSSSQLLIELRNSAVDHSRLDLLAALSPSDALQSHERTQLHRRALEIGDLVYDLARRLEKAWLSCDELVEPRAVRFGQIANEALELSTANAGESSLAKSTLTLAWIQQQVAIVEAAKGEIARVRQVQAEERSPEVAASFHLHSKTGNYRLAMALLNPGMPAPEAMLQSSRRTMWRAEALERFPNPRQVLQKDLKGSSTDQSVLVRFWSSGQVPGSSADQDTIRKAFYQVISGEAGRSQEENRKRFAVKLTELREHPHRKTVVNCAVIRDYFRRAKLNPTFLPQIADYQQLVITSLAGLGQSGNALDTYIKAVQAEGPGALCVFLEPGLSLQKRDEICAGLRRRSVAAAIIDDVDACRLCSIENEVEAHNFVPLLEIVFEQLALEMASPFSSLDGQHVKMETFIGRNQNAQRIALSSEFTRIFSGRKLGKSAFLRYVTHTYDGTKLPSGNLLNVIFITIAGGESEAWIVDCIINEMNKRFTFIPESEVSSRLAPADRFSRYAKRFADAHPQNNVLLVLDEADAFVEGQLRSYDAHREGSLSFRMMKELPTRVDSAQMPRLRVVFSGYRVTNTRGGVWANAGDVLILKPLNEPEAAEFLQGMLGRIGIDIGEHAPFAARRCGFQPAVLIRFGDSLLKRIGRGARSGRRESYVVSYDDVLATMNEQAVLDEIRTVVNNNFQGNRTAAAIFGATLLALKNLEPGMSLEDGPAQVLKQISDIDANLDWLGLYGSQPTAQIERQLQEFIDRELLTVSDAPRFGVREYRLKFPHFLPVLTQQTEVASEVRRHIKHIRSGTSTNKLIESVLPDAQLDAVRYWYRQPTCDLCSYVVVAGQWPAAYKDEKVGVPDRLGCSSPSVARSVVPADIRAWLASGYRIYTDVDLAGWGEFLRLDPSEPLVLLGGVDLLRAAALNTIAGDSKPVELIGTGTLSQATLNWWFETSRALHFESSDAISRIHASTEGVPLLVATFDKLLPQQLAGDVHESELAAALTQLNDHLDEAAKQLLSGPPAVRLSKRELELLWMAHKIGEVADEFDLQRDFSQYWEVVAKEDPAMQPPLTHETDYAALRVLIETGWLPRSKTASPSASALGRVSINTSGAIAAVVRAAGAGLAD